MEMRKCLENESPKTTPFTDCQFVDWVGRIFSALLLFLPRILMWMLRESKKVCRHTI